MEKDFLLSKVSKILSMLYCYMIIFMSYNVTAQNLMRPSVIKGEPDQSESVRDDTLVSARSFPGENLNFNI